MNARRKGIMEYVNNLEEYDTSDDIIQEIRNRYPALYRYDYMRAEQLDEGMWIRTVSLDLEKLSIPGFIVEIKYTKTRAIKSISLYNPTTETFWKIRPSKFYIFMIERGNGSKFDVLKVLDHYNIDVKKHKD